MSNSQICFCHWSLLVYFRSAMQHSLVSSAIIYSNGTRSTFNRSIIRLLHVAPNVYASPRHRTTAVKWSMNWSRLWNKCGSMWDFVYITTGKHRSYFVSMLDLKKDSSILRKQFPCEWNLFFPYFCFFSPVPIENDTLFCVNMKRLGSNLNKETGGKNPFLFFLTSCL